MKKFILALMSAMLLAATSLVHAGDAPAPKKHAAAKYVDVETIKDEGCS